MAARRRAPFLAVLAAAMALPGGARGGGDWTADVVAQAPALRACLAGDGGSHALHAAPAGDGAIRVLLRRGAAAEACWATPDGATVLRRAPAVAVPDPAAPAFFLDRRCADARRVDAPDGSVLGWLAYPAC